MQTSVEAAGTVFDDQLAGVNQLLVPAPPSQLTAPASAQLSTACARGAPSATARAPSAIAPITSPQRIMLLRYRTSTSPSTFPPWAQIRAPPRPIDFSDASNLLSHGGAGHP